MADLVPQLPDARINFSTIMAAIAAQLLADGVVADPSLIMWGTPDAIPQFSGPADILLVMRNATHTPYDAGPGQFELHRYVDVYYRSQAIAQAGGSYQAWITSLCAAGDQILNSVGSDGFWPEDENGNILTNETIKAVGDAAPTYPRGNAVFGGYVATLSITYMPNVNPNRGLGVYPIP